MRSHNHTPDPETIDTTTAEEYNAIQVEITIDRKRSALQEAREQYRQYIHTLREKAAQMKTRTPRAYYCPGPGKMLTAGQYTTAIKMVKAASPDRYFARSFANWYGGYAREIIRHEIRPAIHERINARVFI
jgi:hypothetical protein